MTEIQTFTKVARAGILRAGVGRAGVGPRAVHIDDDPGGNTRILAHKKVEEPAGTDNALFTDVEPQ